MFEANVGEIWYGTSGDDVSEEVCVVFEREGAMSDKRTLCKGVDKGKTNGQQAVVWRRRWTGFRVRVRER